MLRKNLMIIMTMRKRFHDYEKEIDKEFDEARGATKK